MTYAPDQLRLSHFRPVRDSRHIHVHEHRTVLQSWTVPQKLRVLWSLGKKKESLWETIAIFYGARA